jgi:hypothetical protein
MKNGNFQLDLKSILEFYSNFNEEVKGGKRFYDFEALRKIKIFEDLKKFKKNFVKNLRKFKKSPKNQTIILKAFPLKNFLSSHISILVFSPIRERNFPN